MDTWILPGTGVVNLSISNFKFDIVMTLGATKLGFIHPIFHHVSVDFGQTDFYFENGFTEFLVWQAL